ncbi:5540_t:CDS:1, partial [Ambispora leptoticha]
SSSSTPIKKKISTSPPFTQEETTFLNEFIACVDRRLADKLSRQRDIAEEIRALSNNECTISQSTVSKMMRRFTVPRDQVTYAAVRNWIDAQPPPAEIKQEK